MDERSLLDFSSNMTPKRKIDRSGVYGICISGGGIDTKFEHLALLNTKLQTNICSATISDFTLQSPYPTVFQKSEVLKDMVCKVQIKSKTPFTSKFVWA